MCGICGKVYHERSRAVDAATIERMTGMLRHRGPDDMGIHVQGNVGLGHARLSIIDLSSAGRQPMTNEDRTLWLICNGEIYNYRELRDDLTAGGHVFSSNTDTEVILHLYEEEGSACVEKLRGMFAFALWDAPRQRLLLVRDRAGQKPLFYTDSGSAFVFASELKALLQDPSVEKQLNHDAVHDYLTYQYVPGDQSIYKGIRKVPPAHMLMYENGVISLKRYWALSYREKLHCRSVKDYAEKLHEVFGEAVRLRLRSDVPLGAFLSGGIDSSAVVAVMSGYMDRPVRTFSIGFEDGDYDELAYARTVADRYRTDHTEFVVKPDAIGILPDLIHYYDEPYADPSAIPTYYVSQLTRQHVTVALNGDGGDESFAGYERYIANSLAAAYARLPRTVREHVIKPAVDMLPYREYRWSVIRRMKRFIGGVCDDPAERYVQWLCYFTPEMKDALYTPDFLRQTADSDSVRLLADIYNNAPTESLLEKSLYADVMLYLPGDLLVKVDIASMAHGLEARSPFLDHTVMEFAASLPPRLKLRGMQTKYLLKKAFAEMLPPEILYRKKMGFGVPLHRWFQHELKKAVYDVLLDTRTSRRGYFRKEYVQALLDEHVQRKADHSYRIWALFYFELWQRMHVDKSDVLGI